MAATAHCYWTAQRTFPRPPRVPAPSGHVRVESRDFREPVRKGHKQTNPGPHGGAGPGRAGLWPPLSAVSQGLGAAAGLWGALGGCAAARALGVGGPGWSGGRTRCRRAGGCREGGRAGRRCLPCCRGRPDGDGASGPSAPLARRGGVAAGAAGEKQCAGGVRSRSGALGPGAGLGAVRRGCRDGARAERGVVGVVPSSLRPAGAARAFTRKASLAASAGERKAPSCRGSPAALGVRAEELPGRGEKGSAAPALLPFGLAVASSVSDLFECPGRPGVTRGRAGSLCPGVLVPDGRLRWKGCGAEGAERVHRSASARQGRTGQSPLRRGVYVMPERRDGCSVRAAAPGRRFSRAAPVRSGRLQPRRGSPGGGRPPRDAAPWAVCPARRGRGRPGGCPELRARLGGRGAAAGAAGGGLFTCRLTLA